MMSENPFDGIDGPPNFEIQDHLQDRVKELETKVKELEGLVSLQRKVIEEYTEWSDGIGYVKPVKPGHGPCCTCQSCGYGHDECVCEHNEIELILYPDAKESGYPKEL